MIAAARRIEQRSDDPRAVDIEIALLDRALAGLEGGWVEAGSGTLAQRLEDLVTRWAGFIALDVAVDDVARGLVGTDRDRVGQVVEEAIVNAVRHGLASSAQIVIAISDRGVEVKVTDDGIGPRDGRPGLGSTFFDLASAGAWSLAAGEQGGALLTVQIPR
jgi:signal transduction histidine kinase